jgi:Neurotransmitter-gated ion-channel ligand binding domain
MMRLKSSRRFLASALMAVCALLTTSLVSAQETNVQMPSTASLPLRVGVAVGVNSVGRINEQLGTYEALIDVRYRWRDVSLKFNPVSVGGDRQEFIGEALTAKLKNIWSPRLTIANQVGNPARVEGVLFIYADGLVEHTQRIKAVFETKYRFGAFPFDTQALGVRILSTRFTANQIDLIQDQADINVSGFKDDISLNGWNAGRIEFQASTSRGLTGDYYPEMEAKAYLSRLPFALLFSSLVPFILIMLVPTIMLLFVKADIAPRMTLWGASILALIALNFTFSVRYPFLGPDSLFQQLISIGFGYQLLMIFLTVTLMNPLVADRVLSKPVQHHLIEFLRWAVPLLFLGLIATSVILTSFA